MLAVKGNNRNAVLLLGSNLGICFKLELGPMRLGRGVQNQIKLSQPKFGKMILDFSNLSPYCMVNLHVLAWVCIRKPAAPLKK